MEPTDFVLVFLAFAAGGIIKGAAGAGAPLLAVPLMVVLRDVQFAVAVFVLPNIVPNLWQYWRCKEAISSPKFAWRFALAGGLGAGLGSLALAGWRPEILILFVAVALVFYVVFRLLKPSWQIQKPMADKLVVPAGMIGGALQGAAGLSAPVSITFLSTVKLERREFMATISLFFVVLGVVQAPALMALGIMTTERFIYSLLSLIPLMLFMPVGAWIGSKLSKEVFDRLLLLILSILAVKLMYDVYSFNW